MAQTAIRVLAHDPDLKNSNFRRLSSEQKLKIPIGISASFMSNGGEMFAAVSWVKTSEARFSKNGLP